MFANLINTVLGIALVYGAVLKPDFVQAQPAGLLAAGVIIGACALWARESDRLAGFSVINLVLAALAALLACAQLMMASVPALVVFWSVFWIGLTVAVVALWAALYRPRTSA